MKIAILSDAHANFIAFSHCLKLIESLHIDDVYFLGDAVGYMSEAEEVVSILLHKGIPCVKGNHEAMMLGELSYPQDRESIYHLRETYQMMKQNLIEFISGWPVIIEKKIGDKKILFLHGGLDNPLLQYIYPDSNLDSFTAMQYDVIFMGHTHYPFQRRLGSKLIVNVGSCGLPRDQGNLISFVVYDSETGECEILRSYIDVEKVLYKYTDIHTNVKECLYRKASQDIIGTLI